ncbi:hypothetical protein HPP92_012648 [Vanilla planifolia]|uniref:Uncharacterized protein n=1 Tax=Vanilla planifolia TaxID=51239 RepID=A0A835QX92_VANPL|nr:hypothetical protein HPP92_012648 [Vanilla planifolia]
MEVAKELEAPRRPEISLLRLVFCCTVAGGVQYGWALQLSLLTPYVQMNLFSLYVGPRWKAAIVYVVGFWVLDFSNNAVQGPARAMMADLSANIIYAFWMAFGNILGYSCGSIGDWYKWFPFLVTNSCCRACANLKGAFLIAIIFLFICLSVTVIVAKEVPLYMLNPSETEQGGFGIFSVFTSFKNLPPGMPSVLLITSITWFSWFPFNLYNTDWMGREIYHGDPKGTREEIAVYNRGVEKGAFGLLLNSVVLGITSMLLTPLCKKLSSKLVWVIGNFTIFLGMGAITALSIISNKSHTGSISSAVVGPDGLRAGAVAIFTALGFPLAVRLLLYTPYPSYLHPGASLTSSSSRRFCTASLSPVPRSSPRMRVAHSKVWLCIGVLNVSIVIPQVIVAAGAGPWDALFGHGNIPAFALASVVALIGGFIGLAVLPKISADSLKSGGFGSSMH